MEKRKILDDDEKGQIRTFKSQSLSLRKIGRRLKQNHVTISNYLNDIDGYGKSKSTKRQ